MEPFKDTINIDAHFYLRDTADGEEVTREEFIQDMHAEELNAVMIYVGGGFCPLRVAVHVCGDDIGTAYQVFEEWCRQTGRVDEIGELDLPDSLQEFGEYESVYQEIPNSYIKPFLEFEYASAHEWLNHWLQITDDIKHLRHIAITMGMHLDADTIQDDFERAMDEMGYFTPKVKPIPEV